MLRKGQISVIIIMILILGMITGVFYYLKTSKFEQTIETSERKQQLAATRVQPVSEYVESCIKLSIKDGLELLGKQGGYIYRSQGGMLNDPGTPDLNKLYANFEDYKVRYAIFTPRSDVGTLFFAIPPLYPWPEFPYDNGEVLLRGYYGTNHLKPLLKPLPEAIQEQLEFYVINKTIECIDWQTFEAQGLSFETEEMNVSLLIAANDVVFTVDYPIEITDKATGATSNLKEFIVTHPIRLNNIYEFIRFIIDEDVIGINFSIADYTSDQISVNIQPSYVGEDDLIIITDARSRLLGQVYEFRFMRHNRPPALFYISPEMIEGKVVNNLANISFDTETRVLSVNNPEGAYTPAASPDFTIQLDALDPDEDNLTFSFIPPLPYEVPDSYISDMPLHIKVEDASGMIDRQEIRFEAEYIRPETTT